MIILPPFLVYLLQILGTANDLLFNNVDNAGSNHTVVPSGSIAGYCCY